MTREEILLKFPSYVPIDKMPDGAKLEKIKVYRLCKWGIIDRQAFYSNYEEVLYLKMHIKYSEEQNWKDNIDMHSVSTSESLKEIKRLKALKSRRTYPNSIIAEGFTNPECGLCQRTSERREPDKGNNSHVDWWVIIDTCPHECFKEYVEAEKS